ncbi:ABC transporter ATP-binding protein, partial [Lachnospiraceae bacterium]|nr:ABC transporter ATP-binding protein [Lachnospiraceae bacterium]
MKIWQKKAYQNLLKNYITPYRSKFVGLYTLTMLSNIMGLLPIYFMGNIINYVTIKSFDRILYTISILFVLFLGNSILSMGETYLASWLNNKISKRIKDDIYSKATN